MAEEQEKVKESEESTVKPGLDPVRKWTFILLILAMVLLVWYLISDRVTPFTSQARVHALVIPVSPEVSGTVISVAVGNNQRVKAGQELFQLDPSRNQLAVETAEADLQTARQSLGASGANVSAAEAALVSAEANLVRSEKDATRLKRIQKEDPGAISVRRVETAEATLTAAQGQVAAAIANIDKAKQDLGQSGEQNSRILQAQSALDQAKLNLEKTTVRAPEDGVVTDVRVNNGNFANAGTPQLTFISIKNIWVQADFTENNLGYIRTGNTVRMVFDVLPGKTFIGTVRETGYGVAVDSAPLGSLPTIENNRDWLRASQRYPVLIDFQLPVRDGGTDIRVGSQASVIVFTRESGLFNLLARFQIWLSSVLTYAY
jgi:multidrug resistance efflux pump